MLKIKRYIYASMYLMYMCMCGTQKTFPEWHDLKRNHLSTKSTCLSRGICGHKKGEKQTRKLSLEVC